ncbi:GNAT family N-acetyltransferase [Streptomyces griseoaurantiacus]|uniref:GNAT family N-acetyltransferase n=1 Tax=Streptomyces griseoaurantiacus TaxID=68213 RepID=UPI00378ECF5D
MDDENEHPVVRRAVAAEADTVAGLWLRSFDAALPTVRRARTDEEVRGWFREVVEPAGDTWVAAGPDRLLGMMVLDGEELDQLYLDPARRGRGVGGLLLDHAKRLRPSGLALWTFRINAPARRFYERHGFVAVERTDGARNEEREPDVRYVWRPDGPGR